MFSLKLSLSTMLFQLNFLGTMLFFSANIATVVESLSLQIPQAKLTSNTTVSSAQCSLFNQAPSTGRVWTLCEGKQFKSPTEKQKLVGTKTSNALKCTTELSFEQLCCLDYANIESEMNRIGGMTLDLAQVSSDVSDSGSTNAVSFIDDAAALGKNAKQITLCSLSTPTPDADDENGSSGVEAKVDCVAREFTVDEVKTAGGVAAVDGGNILLNARIEFLKKQGLPLSSISLCTESVATCPCTGQPPSSAAQEYIDARTQPAAATTSDPATTTSQPAPTAAPAGSTVTTAAAPPVALMQKTNSKKRGFFSALQTSGSFTMMQAGGF